MTEAQATARYSVARVSSYILRLNKLTSFLKVVLIIAVVVVVVVFVEYLMGKSNY